eukprot:1786027-Amphidinium_carterae.1
MTTTAAISQSTCSLGRHQSTTFWHTASQQPMRTVQFTKFYFRRAEDVSIEFNPIYSEQDPMNFNLKALMGNPIG